MLKKISLVLFVSLALIMNASAQGKGGSFKGTITYQISYPDANLDASQLAQMPKTMTLKLNGNKAKAELPMREMNQTLILDSDAKTTIVLVDINGQKASLKPKKNANPANTKEPITEPTAETKEIAGYVCKKVNIHYGDERSKNNPSVVYYSEELGNNKVFYDNEYKNLAGIPLEFKYKMQGMNMLLTATKIEKGKISNKEFEVPSDYKESTPEDLRRMFGGGM